MFFQKAPPERGDFMTWPRGSHDVSCAATGTARRLDLRRHDRLRPLAGRGGRDGRRCPRPAPVRDEKGRRVAESQRLHAQKHHTNRSSFATGLPVAGSARKKAARWHCWASIPPRRKGCAMTRVPCPDGTLILLTSDGFSALVDLYRRMSAAESAGGGATRRARPARRTGAGHRDEGRSGWHALPAFQAQRRRHGAIAAGVRARCLPLEEVCSTRSLVTR